MTYTCRVCGVTSDAAEFYAGINTRCKECHKVKVKENRAAKADYYREYDAIRFQNDPKVKERHLRYQSTRAGKDASSRAKRKWLNKSPEARAAHIILGNAVRNGRIKKPLSCSKCGSIEPSRKIHAHHDDYALPLSVVWLCAQCHSDHHR